MDNKTLNPVLARLKSEGLPKLLLLTIGFYIFVQGAKVRASATLRVQMTRQRDRH